MIFWMKSLTIATLSCILSLPLFSEERSSSTSDSILNAPCLNSALISSSAKGDQRINIDSESFDCSKIRWGFEVSGRAAALVPVSSKIRKLYGDGWGDYQIELSQSFPKVLSAWAGVQYAYSNGHSISSCSGCIRTETKIHLWPLSAGLKYNFYFGSCTDVYLGAGVAYTFLRIHDHWPFVKHHTSKGGFGGLFKLGAKHYFTRLFFIEAFADYLLQRFYFHTTSSGQFVQRHTLNMDALLLGGGVGFHF